MERQIAVDAVLKASLVCRKIQSNLLKSDSVVKLDESPVTVADYASQAIMTSIIKRCYPDDEIVGEEDTTALRKDIPMLIRITSIVNESLNSEMSSNEVISAIDSGNGKGGKNRFWTMDPIDGTKGFLRGDQYAICLALIENGAVKVGVMGCPNLTVKDELGGIFVAVKSQGAFQRTLSSANEYGIFATNRAISLTQSRMLESFEAAHSSHEKSAEIRTLLGVIAAPIRMDSQAKYASLARGQGEIYFRLPVKQGYKENIWDHASGCLLVEEAGGIVCDIYGKKLDFSCGRKLERNQGIVATTRSISKQVMGVVSKAFKEQ